MAGFPQLRAGLFVQEIDLERAHQSVCLACLSFVTFALDRGDPAEIARVTRRITKDLWAEGLAEPATAAVRHACADGLPEAAAALADLELNGAWGTIARAIVTRLAAELPGRTSLQRRIEDEARARLELAPPELN